MEWMVNFSFFEDIHNFIISCGFICDNMILTSMSSTPTPTLLLNSGPIHPTSY